MNDVSTLTDLLPVVILLFLGIATAILSRLIRVSPIVGVFTHDTYEVVQLRVFRLLAGNYGAEERPTTLLCRISRSGADDAANVQDDAGTMNTAYPMTTNIGHKSPLKI
jgi:hypothetical protein